MPTKPEPLRDWHRLFGLLLTDFFTDTPFVVEVERDLYDAVAQVSPPQSSDRPRHHALLPARSRAASWCSTRAAVAPPRRSQSVAIET